MDKMRMLNVIDIKMSKTCLVKWVYKVMRVIL